MKKELLLLLPILLFFCASGKTQVTPPCPMPPPPGGESCQQTCVYCNFDGYMGINNGTPSGGNQVCGQISLHNDQWFGFVAGSSTISIDVLTSNCLNGDGLQAAFFDDCAADAITCNPGTSGGGGSPLNLTYTNFVPGQTYYLMVDGWSGDVCNFEIDLTEGSITPPPPTQPAVPQGPTKVCPGATVVYTIPPVDGAGYYRWTAPPNASINGGGNNVLFDAPDGTMVTITFGSAGGQVCVQAGNACFPPLKSCLNIVNQPIPPTVKAAKTICFEELPFIWDEEPFTSLNNAGTFTLTSSPYPSALGCDSVIKQTITIKNQIKTNIGVQYVCEGACLIYNGNSYCNTGGPYQEKLESAQGCDSVVQFTVVSIPANAVISPAQPITCTNPSLVLNNNGSTTGPNITYTWTNANWGPIGNQPTVTVTNGGGYNLIVTNVAGNKTCKDTALITVQSNNTPPGASAQGGLLTCFPNGTTVTLQGSSGTTGVNYSWAGPGITPANANLQNPAVTATGTYVLTVSNPANNCSSTATASVTANNTPPVVTAVGGTITCAQPGLTINGGTDANPPVFAWSGPGINPGNQNLEDPAVTVAGTYSVTVTSSLTGCSNTATAIVSEDTAHPVVDAGTGQTITCQQLNVVLSGSGSPAIIAYHWSGPGITPANDTLAAPSVNIPGQYILNVTNPVNGCASADTVLVDASLLPPSVDAGVDQILTCVTTSVALGGNGSSQGADFQANWSGPGIDASNQNQFLPVVSQSGNYTLTVTNTTNGCTSTDNVLVNLDIATPTVDAGTNQTLTCGSTNGVTLQGSGTPANLDYLWAGPGIGANNETQQNPQVSQPGTYMLQVTNPINGCTATDQVNILQDANVPAANAGPDLRLTCTISTVDLDGSASASGAGISYTWSGPGITAANMNAPSPTGITTPGTYQLTVFNANNNCQNTDIVVISLDTITPVGDAGTDLVLNCLNKGADTLDASASSTGVNFTLLWTGPGINAGNENSPLPVITTPGTYTLLVTNTKNNCTATDQAIVSDDQVPPAADAGIDKTIDCVVTSAAIGGNSSAGANFTYLWTGPGITPANATQAKPNVDKAGAYALVVTNTVNGCTATDDAAVALNAVFPTTNAGPDQLLTCTQPTLSLDGSGSDSGASFQVNWNGPGINAGNQGSLSPNIAVPGTYVLSIRNTVNNCQSVDTAIVQENTAVPAASAGADQGLDCATTSITLDGSASATGATITYLWTGPGINAGIQDQQSPDVTVQGTYVLLVTDTGNGCSATDDVVISQDIALPTASAGADILLNCTQSTLPLNGSASSTGAVFQYLWQGPGINTSNFTLQNPVVADSGTYVLTVTNLQNHCTATDQVYAGMDSDAPLTNGGPDQTLTCAKDTLPLDGTGSLSGAGIVYTWSGPGIVAGDKNQISPQVFQPGAYTLTVANTNNGCTATDIVNVGQNVVPPIADAGTDQLLTCTTTGGIKISALASSTGPTYTLQWSGPGINPGNQSQVEPKVTAPGTYTVVITDTVNGCTNSDEVVVNQDQNLPTANAGADQTITCSVNQVTLDASGSTGNGSLQFTWAGPGISPLNQNDQQPTVTQSGTYTVTVVNTLTGCSATDNVQVNLDNSPPQVSATGATITCTNLEVTITSTSSLAGSTFEWSGPDIDLGNINLQNPPVGDPGKYTVVVTAPNGCSASASATVAIDANVPVGKAEGTQLNCFNNGQSLISGEITTPGATFNWTGPNGFSSTVLNPTVTAPGVYFLNITSPNGCTKPYEAAVTADFNAPKAFALVKEDLDCNTTSLVVNGNGSSTGASFTYAWTTADGHLVSGANTLLPIVDAPGQYLLVVTNILNGCSSSTTVPVKYDPAVPTGFDLNVQNIRCFGELNGLIAVKNVLGGTQPFQFSLNGKAAGGTAQFPKLGAGSYTLQLEDANGCILDTTIQISAPGALQVQLEPDLLVNLGESVTVTATLSGTTPIASVTWAPPAPCPADCLGYDTLPMHSYVQTITVVDSNGCRSTDKQLIQVDRTRHVFVPNAFNPNSNDPLNSVLMIQGGKDIREIKSWQVFDRWGNAIFSRNNFQPNDVTHAWDGKYRGNEAPVAVYVWYIQAEFIDGEVQDFKGDVTLLKN